MSSQKKLQVFISSTYTDLKTERQAAVEAILKNGHIPAGMELFAANDEEQMKVIRRWIDESDIFMLLLGGRYGSLERSSKKSYTQLEYEHATASNKPLFSVVLKDSMLAEKIKKGAEPKDVYEQEHPDLRNQFVSTVTGKMCEFAEDIKDIKLAVGNSLREFEKDPRVCGWVRSSSVPNPSSVLEDFAELTKVNTALTKQRDDLQARIVKMEEKLSSLQKYGAQSFDDLSMMLRQYKINVKIEGKIILTNLLDALLKHHSWLAVGVSNKSGVSTEENFLFWNVATPLITLGLAEQLKVPASVHWQRIALTKEGRSFVSESTRQKLQARESKAHEPASSSTTSDSETDGDSTNEHVAGSTKSSKQSKRATDRAEGLPKLIR